MHVQRVVVPGNQAESWTVLDDDGRVVEPAERWLAHLTAIERSPNTVKAYSHDLKDYLVFLASRGLDWREVRLEDIGAFVAWLRLPAEGRDGSVAVLPSVAPKVTESTVNRKLSAINAFYCFHARHGVDVGELLVTWQAPGRGGGRGGYRPFLHHITKGSPQPRRTVALKGAKKLPRILTPAEVQAVLDACVHLRDRFLFALLYDSGCRIGEALGLRHEDIDAASRVLRIEPRTNSNGARVKNHSERSVPISGQLVRLWGDYLHEEYGDLDCDCALCRCRHNTYCPDLAVIPGPGLIRWSARRPVHRADPRERCVLRGPTTRRSPPARRGRLQPRPWPAGWQPPGLRPGGTRARAGGGQPRASAGWVPRVPRTRRHARPGHRPHRGTPAEGQRWEQAP